MTIDYNEYGLDFVVLSKVLRAYGECACCGAKQGSPLSGGRVVLTVHHLDENVKNNRIDNLIPLCQSCHLSQHRKGDGRVIYASAGYNAWVKTLRAFAGIVSAESLTTEGTEKSGEKQSFDGMDYLDGWQ